MKLLVPSTEAYERLESVTQLGSELLKMGQDIKNGLFISKDYNQENLIIDHAKWEHEVLNIINVITPESFRGSGFREGTKSLMNYYKSGSPNNIFFRTLDTLKEQLKDLSNFLTEINLSDNIKHNANKNFLQFQSKNDEAFVQTLKAKNRGQSSIENLIYDKISLKNNLYIEVLYEEIYSSEVPKIMTGRKKALKSIKDAIGRINKKSKSFFGFEILEWEDGYLIKKDYIA